MNNALRNWNDDEAENLFGPEDVITTRPTARITGGRKPYTGPITLSHPDDADSGSELAKVKTMQGVTVKGKKKKEKRKADGSVWNGILSGLSGLFGGDSTDSAGERIVYVNDQPVQKKDNTILYIALGLGVLLIAYMVMKKK